MFGFTGSPCHTCSSRETHSTYRSFFCGLSGALRNDYSPAARSLVNRDSTFLSLLTAGISGQVPQAVTSTCCNPLAVPGPLFKDDLHARYAAAVTVCGLATKLEDDRQDETGVRRFAAKYLGKAVGGMTDRATSFLNTLRFPTSDVVEMMREQEMIERRRPGLMESAAPTAMAYGIIFGHAAEISNARNLRDHFKNLGEKLGQLVYWKDAHDDREKDARRGRFNALQHSPREEFEGRFTQAAADFQSLAATTSTGPLQSMIDQILSSTLSRHLPLLAMNNLSHDQQERLAELQIVERNKSEKERNRCENCCDSCFCVQIGGEGLCGLGCESISCCS